MCRCYAHSGFRVSYTLAEISDSERDVAPSALLDTGLRWHARAYDRKSGEFRDFVLTRIQDAEVLKDASVEPHECPDQDIQWTRIVELELVTHPDQPRRVELPLSDRTGRGLILY